MTGQKDRYSTTEKLWKLDDETLKTPDHDKLVLMLLDENYLKQKIEPILPKTPENFELVLHDLKSEYPIFPSKNHNFIIGYWDVVVLYERYNNTELRNHTAVLIECKPKVISFGKTLRQLRTYLSYPFIYDGEPWWAKTIPILFTPDVQFKKAFESQGIMVLHP